MAYKRLKSVDPEQLQYPTVQRSTMSQQSGADDIDVLCELCSQHNQDDENHNPDDPMEEEDPQATPIYNSQQGGPALGFALAGAEPDGLGPSSQPSCSQGSVFRNLACKPRRSMEELTGSVLANATLWQNFCLDRAVHTHDLMIIPEDYYCTMYGKSRSLHIEKPPEQTAEEGVELSFVFGMSSAGLPQEAMKVIYFFSKVLAASRTKPLNGFCVATETLKPQVSMPHQKITHIVSEVQADDLAENILEDQEMFGGEEGVNLQKLIAVEDVNAEGTQKRRVPILKIHVCLTGAVCQLPEGEIRHYPICNVRVIFLTNIAPLPYIVDYLFPYNSSSTEARKEYAEMSELLQEILFYQSSHVIGDTSGRLPSAYYSDPTGRLGWSTICHPLMDPLKITSIVKGLFPDIEFLKIIGFYDINWLGNPSEDPQLNAYMKYYHAYSGEVHKLYKEMEEALKVSQADGKSKKKRTRRPGGRGRQQQQEEQQQEDPPDTLEDERVFKFTPLFGYPMSKETVEDGKCYFVSFARALYPMVMQYLNLEVSKPSSFQQFVINFGTLPLAVSSFLMDFRLFDYQFPDATGIAEFTLTDPEPASMAKVIEKYYSITSNSMEGLIMPGCLKPNYSKVVTFLKNGIEKGECSPESAIRTFMKCEIYCNETFHGMVEGGLMHSKSVDDMREMIASVTRAENNPRNPLNTHEELLNYMRHVLGPRYEAQNNNAVDPFVESTEFFFGALNDANRSMHLNSINLKTFLAVMMSVLHYALPTNSDTVPAFGQLIFVAPACGTLSEFTQNKQQVPVVGCPNSSGKDFVPNWVTKLYKNLAELVGSPEFSLIMQMARATVGSLDDSTSVTFADGKIVKMPCRLVHGQFFMDTELRGDDLERMLKAIINFLAARGSHQDKMTMTTNQNMENGRRELNNKIPCKPVQQGYMCTNQRPESKVIAELLKTLQVVAYITPPGSISMPPEPKTSKFADVTVHCAQTRSVNFKGESAKGAPIALAMSHLYTHMKINLPLWAGAGPLNISPVVASVLDFMMFYIKNHLKPLFHQGNASQNFNRLESVHVAKGVVLSSWVYTLQALIEYKDKDEACKEARRRFMFDALAITNVPFVCYELICRLLHWGPVIVACLFIREVDMPIIPLESLVALLKRESRPTRQETDLYSNYMKIQHWLIACVDAGRFCSPNGCEDKMTVCEYISSGCAADGESIDSTNDEPLFIVDNVPDGWKTGTEGGKDRSEGIMERLARNIMSLHRKELVDGCFFTDECIQVIIHDMMASFSVWLPKFLEIPQADTRRFLEYFDVFGKHSFVPYKADRDCHPPFAIKTAWPQAKKAGIAVNAIQLLLLGSLTGNRARGLAHPDVVYALSKGLVKSILERAPRGAVPRNHVYIPSFNGVSNETIVMSGSRVENFSRPNDISFALTGEPSHFPNVKQFAPEDLLHMAGLCGVASYFGFSVLDCPATASFNYHIVKNRHYCAYNQNRNRLGMLCYNGRNVSFCHFPNNYKRGTGKFNGDYDDESKAEDDSEQGSQSQDKDYSQPMESEGAGEEVSDNDDDDDDDDDENEVKSVLGVRTWQAELRGMGFILLPLITRAGACVTVVDEDMGERIGVLVPPPDEEFADGNFHIKERCYAVSVPNRRGLNYLAMPPFEVFESLIPIGTVLYLKLESASARIFMDRLPLNMSDGDRSRFAVRVVMSAPNVFQPEIGMAYVNYVVHGDQKTEVICVPPSDLLVRHGGRTVIKHVFA